MAMLVREPGSKPIGQFVTPYKGTWSSIAANILTTDQLYDSMNVFIREGRLRDRPGLALFTPTIFAHNIIGGAMVTAPDKKVMLAFTYDRAYRLEIDDVNWDTDTIIPMAEGDHSLIDCTFIETASQYVCIIANGETALKKWIYNLGVTAITATVGEIPRAKSVCTAASRIVALVDHHTLWWSDVLTYDAFNPLSYSKKIAETNDASVCVRKMSSLSFAVYKERSIYLAKATGRANGAAFSIELAQEVEGPAGVHAITTINNGHIYMTSNGRIGLFDGSSYVRWIADGIWFYLQTDIDQRYVNRTLAVFDYRLHTVTFYYPRAVEGDGHLKGMVTVNVPLDGSGITDYSTFLGLNNKPISFGYEMRFDGKTHRSILFSAIIPKTYFYSENHNTDDETAFDCMLQTGLIPMPDMAHHQPSLELFIERANGNGSVDVRLITSDALENTSGTIESLPSHTLNLEFNPVREYLGFLEPTRFVGIQLKWSSLSTVRYIGALIFGRPMS